jgi:2-haloacid dehalogenase/putative hydrolase of the HAD superfamily
VRDRVLTFDCYGTLIDWESGIAGAFASAAARAGRPAPDRRAVLDAYAAAEAEVEAGPWRPYREVLTAAAARAAQALGWAVDETGARFLAESLPSWTPFPDTNPALERLAGRFRLGILSNVDEDLLAATRRHLSVEWDLVVTAEAVRSYKPAHAHWIEARRRLGAAARRWTHVAQSHGHDVVPAVELGVPVVWVNRTGVRLDDAAVRPDHEVRSLAEAADLLLDAGTGDARARRPDRGRVSR